MMKKALNILLVLILGVLVLGAFNVFRFLSTGAGQSSTPVKFEVPPGTAFHAVAGELAQKGLVSDAFKFRLYGKLTGMDKKLKRGEYLLNPTMTPKEVMGVLISGKSVQYPVTFPEGTNMYEMAEILQQKGFFKAKDFLTLVKDKKFVKRMLGIDVSSLEGYLFPETYMLTKFTTKRELVENMVHRFKQVYGEIEPQATVKLPMHDIVTLASIVEKETGAEAERPIIASVFYNRLAKGMRLQSDPTIIYGILEQTGQLKRNITKADIHKPTRYNTYTVPRLPFGPIANPGKAALLAALHPAQTDYLYFVSRNDGTHVFSKTYAEQMREVRAFQMNPKARQGKSWRDLKQAH